MSRYSVRSTSLQEASLSYPTQSRVGVQKGQPSVETQLHREITWANAQQPREAVMLEITVAGGL